MAESAKALQDEALSLMDRVDTFRPEGIRILLETLGRERDLETALRTGTVRHLSRLIQSIYGKRRLEAFLAKVRKYDEQRSGLYRCDKCGLVTDFRQSWRANCPDCGGRLEEAGKFYDLLNVGKDKWLWLAWESEMGHWYFNPENLTELGEGIEPSKEAALKKVNDLLGEVRWFGGNLRAKTRQKEESEAYWQSRANHEASDPKAIEYLYRRIYLSYSGTFEWEEAPIIKRTKKRVYVKARRWDKHATVLDREELEREGSAWGGRRPKDWYFTLRGKEAYETEHAAREAKTPQPECFEILGVKSTSTLREIKRAYRKKARISHPDTGGNNADFIKVQEAYERVMFLLRHRS